MMDIDWKYRYWLHPAYENCDLSLSKTADTLPAGVAWHEGLTIQASDGFPYRVALVQAHFDEKQVHINLEELFFVSRGPITEQERQRWRSLGWKIDLDIETS